jgi:hypothetical protein
VATLIGGDGVKIELGGRGARTQWRNHFWRDFSKTFAGREMRDAWMALFRRSLAPRFPKEDEDAMSQFEIRLDLSRDGEGYSITPHTVGLYTFECS